MSSTSAWPGLCRLAGGAVIDGLDVRVTGIDGSPLRRLVLDPTKDYQPQP